MEKVTKDLVITLENKPGTLYKVGDALGKAGVNIEGFCVVQCGEGEATLHLVCDDPTKATSVLENAGFPIEETRDVVVLEVTKDQPGLLAKVLKPISEQGINLAETFTIGGNRICIGAEDIGRVRDVISSQTPEGVKV
jgi:hypothetical protein